MKKEETEEVFKLALDLGGEVFTSINITARGVRGLSLDYQIGKITRPIIKNSLIFAFLTPESSHHFAVAMGYKSVILRCEGVTAQGPDVAAVNYYDLMEETDHVGQRRKRIARAFWNMIKNGEEVRRLIYVGCVPYGTCYCKWVKPLEIVERYNAY